MNAIIVAFFAVLAVANAGVITSPVVSPLGVVSTGAIATPWNAGLVSPWTGGVVAGPALTRSVIATPHATVLSAPSVSAWGVAPVAHAPLTAW